MLTYNFLLFSSMFIELTRNVILKEQLFIHVKIYRIVILTCYLLMLFNYFGNTNITKNINIYEF